MQYRTLIDNVAAKSWGLTINQAYILDWIIQLSTWADKTIIDGDVFYFASRYKATEELPLLTDKADTIYRYYKQLEDLGLLILKKIDNKDYVAVTKKCAIWGRVKDAKQGSDLNPSIGNESDKSEMNPNKLGFESENNSDLNPTYNTISINQTTNNQTTQAGDEENSETPKPPLVNSPLGLMTKIWKHHFPNYVFVPKNDNPALREISEIIFKKQPSLVDEQTLKEGFSNFCKKVKSHNFYSNTSLGTVRNKIQDILMHDSNKSQNGTFKRSQLDSGVPQDAYASLAKTVNS